MMDEMLHDKNIVIIGGSTGLGFSAALAFVKAGARVVIVGRNHESLAHALDILGPQSTGILGDACQPETASQAIKACISQFGSFTGLYHVAGGSGRKMGDGPLHNITMEGWNKTIELNLTSVMLSNQAAVRAFLQSGHGGTILNMGSVLAHAPSPVHFATHAYAAAKSAIVGFSKSIAAYYAKNNIRVNVISPALVETPMSKRAMGDRPLLAYIHTKQPLDGGRIGVPEDLDGLAAYFMSDASGFITGQVISVDGGWSISDGQMDS